MKTGTERRRPLSPRTRSLLGWSRNLLLISGVLALTYVGFALLDAKIFQTFENRRFEEALRETRSAVDSSEASGFPLSLSTGRPETNLPRSEIPGASNPVGSSLGRIEIDAIGLSVMIQEGTDPGTLRRSVGHISGTSLPGQRGNVAIAGHRDTFFRPLRRIRKNDQITLTTLDGTYRYQVDFTKVVEPEDTYVLDDSNEAILTLVTCYPFNFVGSAPERFVVRAHRLPQ